MSDVDIMDGPSYKEMATYYKQYFSLGHLEKDISKKFALISLICYVTEELKKKKPDVTYYQTIYKLASGMGLPGTFIKALAIICEDFSYGCTEFPTFEIKPNEMVKTIKNLLGSYTPF